jgi:DNA-binding beta-propeller fold protein YncE
MSSSTGSKGVVGNGTKTEGSVKRRRIAFAVLLVFGLALIVYALFPDHKPPVLGVLKTIPLGGEGKWDYLCVDAEARRLYVPRTTTVQVVDLDNGVVVGAVAQASSNRVHGVALAPERNLGFVTAGKDRCVNAFDLTTLSIIRAVKTAGVPDGIVYDPASKHIFVNHMGGDITVIDPAALDQTVTIPVEGRLEFSVADGQGHVFVCVQDKNEVVQIDSNANQVLARWPLRTGEGPTGLAIDTKHMRLFAGCGNEQMVILDAKTGAILGTTRIGKGVDGVAFEPTLGLAMSANGKDGTVSVVQETETGKFETIQTVKTFIGAKTITIDPKTHQFLLPCNLPDGKGGETLGIVVVGAEKAK